MRRLVLLLPFVATTLLAQWSRPQVRVETADGQETVFSAPEQPTGDFGVIVEFRDPPLCRRGAVSAKAARTEYEAAFRRFRNDIKSSSNITYEYYELFNGVALTAPASEIAAIRQLPYVKRVHPDMPVRAFAATPPANIVKIGADQVWSKLGSRGAGVTVAIIDTGIDYTHPALGGGFGPGFKVIGGYDFVNRDSDPKDDNMHGTHVAGIIAGNSDQLLGVAPDASLLAYKVLNASGSGKTSDVLAGIERAADPNQDGDFSDHADVANLSLGGIGNPDDAQSIAIDNGTAVGVVYCVAAGNAGSAFHSIASPGVARSAITVGATDLSDTLASFSSRGPNMKDAALKPDVLAPGVSIVSSVPGGKYASLSGTSMATPHIAGVAALVKSLHRDWTAQQIKSAIVDNASFLILDLMAEGGGRVDALAAANASTVASPSSISLGEDHLPQAKWSPGASLHITNVGSQTAQYKISALTGTGISVSVTPSEATVDPGASIDVSIGYTFTNSQVVPSASLTSGGVISITDSTTKQTTSVPWAAVKAARVLLTYDKLLPLAFYVDRATGSSIDAVPLDLTTEEAFLRGANYDVVAEWGDIDPASFVPGNSFRYRDLRVHYLEGQTVADDTTFALNSNDASHAVTLDARNENGGPLVTDNYDGYASTGRIVLPPGGKILSVLFEAFPARTWHVTDLPEKVLIQELNYDFPSSRFYIVQHKPLNGITGDATLTAGGADLKRVSITAAIPPSATDQRIVLFINPIVPTGDQLGTLGLVLHPTAPFFNTTLFLSPDTDSAYSMASTIETITDNVVRYVTPQMRIIDGNLMTAVNGTHVAPWSYAGDGLIFGNGLHFPRQQVVPTSTATQPNLFTDFVGQLGEIRASERLAAVTTVYAADSSVLTTGARYPMPLDLTQAGPYTITVVDSNLLEIGVPRKSTVTFSLDSSRPDFTPPTFTTLMLFDGKGQIATHLDSHGAGALVFGAADYAIASSGLKTYQPIAGDQTKVWFRYSGSQQWRPLTISQVGEDEASGIVYRADLTNVANAENVLVDLKFDVADLSGNTTSFVMQPAFAVGRDSWFGRRSPQR